MFVGLRNKLLSDPRFQRGVVRWPIGRAIARRRAAALFDLVAGFVYSQTLAAWIDLRLGERLATATTLEHLATATGIAADPLVGAVICSKEPSADQADAASPAHHAVCSLCALCTAGLAVIVLPAAPAPVALPVVIWQTVSWPIPPPAPLATPDHSPGQPRAPPTLA